MGAHETGILYEFREKDIGSKADSEILISALGAVARLHFQFHNMKSLPEERKAMARVLESLIFKNEPEDSNGVPKGLPPGRARSMLTEKQRKAIAGVLKVMGIDNTEFGDPDEESDSHPTDEEFSTATEGTEETSLKEEEKAELPPPSRPQPEALI